MQKEKCPACGGRGYMSSDVLATYYGRAGKMQDFTIWKSFDFYVTVLMLLLTVIAPAGYLFWLLWSSIAK